MKWLRNWPLDVALGREGYKFLWRTTKILVLNTFKKVKCHTGGWGSEMCLKNCHVLFEWPLMQHASYFEFETLAFDTIQLTHWISMTYVKGKVKCERDFRRVSWFYILLATKNSGLSLYVKLHIGRIIRESSINDVMALRCSIPLKQ